MTRPKMFFEPFCGSAAVTLRLLGGTRANPPIAYMGGKRGYAAYILANMGLRQGLGAEAVWLNDIGPWGKVWAVLAMPGGAAAVASIIRGWADEDPRALWDRLRAQGWGGLETPGEAANWLIAVGESVLKDGEAKHYLTRPDNSPQVSVASVVDSVAGWLCCSARSFGAKGPRFGFDGHDESDTCRLCRGKCHAATATATATVASWLVASSWSYEQGNVRTGFVGPGERRQDTTATATATATAGEVLNSVASWLVTGAWCYRQGDQSSGGPVLPGERRQDTTATAGVPVSACPSIATSKDSRQLCAPDGLDAEGWFVFCDPPYSGTTGYGKDDIGRADVVTLAKSWSDAGAVVCISEAEPLADLGWEAVEITGGRKGQARTFSKQKREWLTLNRTPLHRVPEQVGMFA